MAQMQGGPLPGYVRAEIGHPSKVYAPGDAISAFVSDGARHHIYLTQVST